jgi:hypothetical protein
MTCCDERNVLRRAGHLSKLAWELPLTADWYLHLYADPCYLSRPAAPSGYAFQPGPLACGLCRPVRRTGDYSVGGPGDAEEGR